MKVISHIVKEMNEAAKEKALHFNIDPMEIKWGIAGDHDSWIMEDLIPLWFNKGKEAVEDEIAGSFNTETIVKDLHDALAHVIEDKEADESEITAICNEITNAFTTTTLTLTKEDKEKLVQEFIDIAWEHFNEVRETMADYLEGSVSA